MRKTDPPIRSSLLSSIGGFSASAAAESPRLFRCPVFGRSKRRPSPATQSSAFSFDHLVGAASTSTLYVTCQRKYGPNNSVGCTGNKLRHDAQVDAKLRTKYRQDEKDTYQERQSVWLQPGERHCQSIWK